jgi:predicted component of type VI protein secretion system
MQLSKPTARILPWLILPALAPLPGKEQPQPVHPPPRLEIQGEAAAGINRDPVGNPLSVVVRIYQLRDKVESASSASTRPPAAGRSRRSSARNAWARASTPWCRERP